ncbi:MAG: right-handed parallel beta-helix repeat-containing protein [Bacteroidia bacterium]|nr:right-handed parallel beta-helix repeat-containing protein [Bacteroidia bacterium]
MKLKNLLFCFVLILLVPGCKKKEDNKIIEYPERYIDLSELATKHDYYLPFAIVNESNNIRSAILNNEAIDFAYGDFIEFEENGFYQLVLEYRNSQQPNDTFLFTTKTRERENSEWGIRAWVPAPFKTVSLGSEDVEIYYPHRYTDLIKVPFIFYVKESGTVKAVYCQGKVSYSGDNFNIKQGVGSVNIAASAISDKADFMVGGKQFSASLARIQEPPIELQGTITSSTDIPANSFVRIPGDLNILSTGSLTIHEGAVILIDETVDINVSGPIVLSGTAGNPIFVTCSRNDKYWGGFITQVSGGTIEAQYTIFCQSGYHDSEGYNWGHSGRQALFYTENSTLKLDHCFMLDNIGQIFYPQYATLTLDDILVQRAQTGGQINYSDLTLRNSFFTDFPDDSSVFEDKDNDALYLSASDAEIDNTTFMFARDDGLDSGNTEGGEITVTNCRFEACFHEGAALSSGNMAVKNHTFTDCVFTNCGQGLELGFSSPNHSVVAENCMFLNNGIGIRYGDNYDWSDVNGKMLIKNSFSLYNDKDVWNMVRMNWGPKLENLSFENTMVSKLCPQYPDLEIKND